MADEADGGWTTWRRARWGPARITLSTYAVDVVVGDVALTLDLHDRRSVAEVRADPHRRRLTDGVPVLINGDRAATVARAPGSPVGIVRRERFDVAGDGWFAGSDTHLTARGLPTLLTLRDQSGWLVTSGRVREPLNMLIREYSIVRDRDVLRPRVSRRAGPQHVALWLAMKNHVAI